MAMSDEGWRIGVDIGGTFTDVVLWRENSGQMINEKLLTTPQDPSLAVIEGIATALEHAGIDASQLTAVVHGTTLVANALIERKGVLTGLITTAGFRDVLEIGREWRYDLFNLDLDMPRPLVARPLRLEVGERVDAQGEVVTALDMDDVDAAIASLAAAKVRSVAVCFLHAYLNADHEQAVAERLARDLPDVTVSLSSDVSPELGEYERTSTTVANAYVRPIVQGYVERLVASLTTMGYRRDLLLMLSDGRCVSADVAVRYPIRLVQSGPAGGAEAARLFGRLAHVRDVLCFDMGGTTAKACLIPDGEPERTVSFEVARETRFAEGSGLPLQIPAIDMIETGAGGGSLTRVDERGLLQVGPESASADPGPVCYGLGNEIPTVTDCDLLLGYLDENSFLGGRMTLDKAAAERAVAKHLAEPLGIGVIEAAWGVHETVNAGMAQAAAIHAIERALDVTRFSMLPIGGAGPVHACGMARKMNIDKLICPPGAGVASAIGLLASAVSFEIARAAPALLSELDWARANRFLDAMTTEASALVARAGVKEHQVTRRYSTMMRYLGQGYEIEVAVRPEYVRDGNIDAIKAAFGEAYEHRYGRQEEMPVEVLSWRLAVLGPRSSLGDALAERGAAGTPASPTGERPVWFENGFVDTPVYRRETLVVGQTISGPAIVEETESTLVVWPEFSLSVDPALNLILVKTA
ncbi:MAG: N-methylhydantoinase A [Gammaproteobacteria bacterium]|jgi:N-methylhydantoinase A